MRRCNSLNRIHHRTGTKVEEPAAAEGPPWVKRLALQRHCYWLQVETLIPPTFPSRARTAVQIRNLFPLLFRHQTTDLVDSGVPRLAPNKTSCQLQAYGNRNVHEYRRLLPACAISKILDIQNPLKVPLDRQLFVFWDF